MKLQQGISQSRLSMRIEWLILKTPNGKLALKEDTIVKINEYFLVMIRLKYDPVKVENECGIKMYLNQCCCYL